ncbi:acetyl-CoA carboxylase biotin carboxyl carrier protein subunit [Clostridium felsineum]|uniref:biotin/lipoyl-containing protein n=2 Tax=Clostridium felsineum TaxID=36839 RepID=UPI00098C68A9|nr:biotin/lipoyl-containing protein [Clostridium felsineum]MCR3759094.1 acetyl-CoA carboxylase biotin carboxyl carrier protein subunit [Clostridium felsineum]URZ00206.1 hypothetical protein CLAUR_001940 [Clostridium felsineum]URZ16776.1 hypothetical protein CLFE_028230 [Clostridium felsineum DSM 794]
MTMKEKEILKLINQMTKSNISYIELKSPTLSLKMQQKNFHSEKSDNIIFNNEICCTKEDDNIVQIKSLYVGIVNIFNIKTDNIYAKLGSKVLQGQTLCNINYLNLSINVSSSVDGILSKSFINDKDLVEYGQILFEITKD